MLYLSARESEGVYGVCKLKACTILHVIIPSLQQITARQCSLALALTEARETAENCWIRDRDRDWASEFWDVEEPGKHFAQRQQFRLQPHNAIPCCCQAAQQRASEHQVRAGQLALDVVAAGTQIDPCISFHLSPCLSGPCLSLSVSVAIRPSSPKPSS